MFEPILFSAFYLLSVIVVGILAYYYGRLQAQLEYEKKQMDALWEVQRKHMISAPSESGDKPEAAAGRRNDLNSRSGRRQPL